MSDLFRFGRRNPPSIKRGRTANKDRPTAQLPSALRITGWAQEFPREKDLLVCRKATMPTTTSLPHPHQVVEMEFLINPTTFCCSVLADGGSARDAAEKHQTTNKTKHHASVCHIICRACVSGDAAKTRQIKHPKTLAAATGHHYYHRDDYHHEQHQHYHHCYY